MRPLDWLRRRTTAKASSASKSRRFRAESLVPKLEARRLEERRLLSADGVPVDLLVVDAGESADDGTADVMQVEYDTDSIRVLVNGEEAYSGDHDQFSTIQINGSSDNDVLIADLLAGVRLVFDGGGGDDVVQIQSDEAFNSIEYELHGNSAGTIHGSTADGAAALTFQNTERIVDDVAASQRSLELPDAVLSAELGSLESTSRFQTNDLTIEFRSPSESLSIDTTATGPAGGQQLRITDWQGGGEDLLIRGSHDDSLVISGSNDIVAGGMHVSTGAITLDGTVHGQEGTVDWQATSTIDVEADAQIINNGGQVALDSGAEGTTRVAGLIDVTQLGTAGQGGVVHLLGDEVELAEGALVDASGLVAGGTVLVGGGLAGANPAVRNASETLVESGAEIRANALTNGSGGRVIVWADVRTRFHGVATARGGTDGGDGGFVEISGKRSLVFDGWADAAAPAGAAGTVLFDPENIIIEGAAGGSAADNALLPDLSNATVGLTGTFTIDENTLEGLLATSNIILEATNDILLRPLSSNLLSLATGAGNSITITADSDGVGGGSFIMESTMMDDEIRTAGGDINITAAGTTLNRLNAGGGTITINISGTGEVTDFIDGAGNLVKDGAGTLSLNDTAPGTSYTYSGDTIVNAGRLDVNAVVTATANVTINGGTLGGTGSITTGGTTTIGTGGTLELATGGELTASSVSIDGGTLAGTGTINAPVTMTANGGSVSPGTSPGIVTVNGDVTFDAAGSFDVEINGTTPGTDHDQLRVEGDNRTVMLNGATLNVTLGAGLSDGNSFVVIDNVDGAAPISDFADTFGNAPDGGFVGNLPLTANYSGGDGNDLELTYDSTPDLVGSAGADVFLVELVGTDVRVTLDPGGANTVLMQTQLSLLNGLNIDGGAGDDRLIVDHSSGGFVDLDISFNGNTENDALAVIGDSVDDTAAYTPGATTGDGAVVVANGADTMTIDFVALEPVDISGMATATLLSGGAIDGLTLNDGVDDATGAIPALVVTGSTDATAIEQVHFFNNTTVVIDVDSVAGADTITVNSATVGFTNLTIESGGTIDGMTNDGTADISGATITLSADNGGIGTAGALDVTATTELNADTTTDGANIVIDSIGNLPVGLIDAAAGTATLNSTGDINASAADAAADVVAATINLTAIAGGIGNTEVLDVTAATALNANSTTDNANIVIDSVGDLPIGLVNAGVGNVVLTATDNPATVPVDGALIDANGAAVNLVATSATLSAVTGIGTGAAPIDTTITNLAATNTTSGGIFVQETNTLVINGTGVRTQGGNGVIDIDVDAGSLTNDSVVTAHGSGSVTLNADAGTVDINAVVSSTTGALAVTGDAVTQDANLATGGTGTIGVTADTTSITMADGTSATAGSGAINYLAQSSVALGLLTTTGDVDVTATTGAITDNTAAVVEGNNIEGATATLTAATGIGAAGAADIDTTITNLVATNTTSGGIFVHESNTLVINGTGVRTQGGNGVIDIDVDAGSLTNDSVVTADGSGSVTLNADAGTVDINAVVSSTTGALAVTGNAVTQDANLATGGTGTIGVTADTTSITMANGTSATAGSGAISYTAQANVALSQLTTTGNADVTATNGNISDANGATTNITATTAVLDAAGQIGDLNGGVVATPIDALETAVSNLSVTRAVEAAIDNTIAGGLTVTSVTPGAAAAGAVLITNDTDLTVSSQTLTLGDSIGFVSTTGSLTIPDAAINVGNGVGGGTIRLEAATDGQDVQDATDTVLDQLFTAATLVLSSGTGESLNLDIDNLTANISDSTGGGAGDLTVAEANGITLVDVDTVNGDIDVTAALGNITALDVDAPNSMVTLNSTSGNVNDGGATSEVIAASDLLVQAELGIVNLNTAVTNLAAETEEGNLQVFNTGNLNITTINAVAGATITDTADDNTAGEIQVTAEGFVTVNAAVVNNDAGNVTLAAEGATAANDLTVNAAVSTVDGAGAVRLFAGDTINVTGANIVTAAGAGLVLLGAGEDYNGGANQNGNAAGGITLAENASVTSQDGNITLRAPGNIAVSTVNANSNADLVAGDVIITADFDGVASGLADGSGAISENTAAEASNIVGATATLTAATGIGAAGVDDIDTTITNLAATNTTSGGIFIQESNTLVINGTGVRTQGGNGVIDIDVDAGSLTNDSVVTAHGSGSVTLNADAGTVDINAVVSSTTGALAVTGDLVTQDANLATGGTGTIGVTADTTSITMANGTSATAGSGTINYLAQSSVALGLLTTTGNVDVTATTGAITDNTAAVVEGNNIEGATVTLTADDGIGAGTGNLDELADIDVDANLLVATNTTSGTIQIDEANSVGLGAIANATRDVVLDAGGAMTDGNAAANNILAESAIIRAGTGIGTGVAPIDTTITNLAATNTTSGGIFVQETNTLVINGTGVRTLAGNGVIDIDVDAGSLTNDSVVTADGSGSVTLNADAGTVDINAVVSSTTGALAVTGDAVTQDANLATGGTGTIGVTADTTSITMADGTSATAGSGTINYLAQSSVALSLLTTTGDVDVTATIGAITDNTAAVVEGNNIEGATVTLTADDGIGSGTGDLGDAADIDVDAATLNASNTTSGAIQILDANSFAVGTVANATRAVVLDAGGSITDGNAAGTLNITAGDAILRTSSGLGASGAAIDTDAARIEATGGTGGLFIINQSALEIADVSAVIAGATATNDVEISTTAGDLVANAVVTSNDESVTLAGANDLALNALVTGDENVTGTAGADVRATAAVTATNQDATLTGGNDVDIDAAITAGDDVTASAGVMLSIDGNITAGTGVDLDFDTNSATPSTSNFSFGSGALTTGSGIAAQTVLPSLFDTIFVNGVVRYAALDSSIENAASPDITNGGTAIIDVVAPGGSDFTLQIDWREASTAMVSTIATGDPFMGTPDTTPATVPPENDTTRTTRVLETTFADTDTMASFSHTYFANPDGAQAQFIDVVVWITDYAGGAVTIEAGTGLTPLPNLLQDAGSMGGNLGAGTMVNFTNQQMGVMAVVRLQVLPFLVGMAIPLPESLTPDAPPPTPVVPPAAPVAPVTLINVQSPLPSTPGAAAQPEERFYQLRIVSLTQDGELEEPTDERVDLNDPRLKAIQPFNPSKLPQLFRRLPADRYRVYLIEDGAERLMLEFVIEQSGGEGRPIELPEESDDGVDAPTANGSGDAPETTDGSGEPVSLNSRINQPTFAERLGQTPLVASGGLVFGAALMSQSARRERAARADRRMAAFARCRRTIKSQSNKTN